MGDTELKDKFQPLVLTYIVVEEQVQKLNYVISLGREITG